MKRKTLLFMLLLALLAPWTAKAQTYTADQAGVIGTGTSAQSCAPIDLYYKSFLNQSIYTADEIGLEGKSATIKTISFQYDYTTSYTSNSFTVYLGNTTKSSFSSNTDWITTGNMSSVYTGTITTGSTNGAWVTITLSSTFSYTGGNLVVCLFDNNCDSYPGTSSSDWRYTTTSDYKFIYYRSDGTAPTISTSTSGTRSYSRPNIKLNIGGTSASITSATFYDSGGSSGAYAIYEDYIWTFYPSTTGGKVILDITSFASEGSWDYFRVYDGENTSATNMLNYSGSSPGTTHFVATNSAGAITVWWHSDSSNNYAGWAATLSVSGPPTVTTSNTYNNLTSTSVNLGGTINSMGGTSSVTAGICLSTTNPPTTSNTYLQSNYTSTGTYSKDFTGLTPGTTYYYRAYAYNSNNSFSNPTYGDTYYFTTPVEVAIGSTSSTNSNIPTYTYYNYSLTQQIYKGSEIGYTGTINSISFYHSGSSSIQRTLVIYMKNTTASTLSAYDSSPGTTVYSGSVTFAANAWTTINLSSAFSYSNICNNLMVTVDDNTGSYENNHPFAVYSTGENRAMYVYNDDTNYTPTSSNTLSTMQSNNSIKLNMTSVTGYKILTASSNDLTMGSFSLSPSGTNCTSGNYYAYTAGTSVSLTAVPNTGHSFVNWTVDGSTVTGNPTTVTMSANHNVVANFEPTTYQVSVTAGSGGSVSGGGSYTHNQGCTLTATPNSNYCFLNWTENGSVVSTASSYSFLVTANRNLTANFVSLNPNSISVSGTTVTCGNSATLTASGLSNVIYNWYSDAECTQLVQANSATLTTPVLTSNTTYYVKAVGGNSLVEDARSFTYTGSSQSFTIPSGTLFAKLEVWGAQGGGQQVDGNTNGGVGGKGGYSVGTLSNLSGLSSIYVYVGGQGGTSNSQDATSAPGGWNGGGTAFGSSSGDPGCGGGGATDIRLNGSSLYYRVLVAGGGGGGGEDSEQGGYGGGTTGGTGSSSNTTGGTQTDGGTGYAFGIGASTQYDGGAGGGGWYGGGCGGGSQTIPTSNSESDSNGGCGGSGYVWTAATARYAPSSYSVSSSYYLVNAQTIAGNASMPNPDGGTMTGRQGNGYARITLYTTEPCEGQAKAVTVTVTAPSGNDITVSGTTTIACGNSTTLTAGGVSGATYNWYSDAACTQLVQANSATLSTGTLYDNTTYYVQAVKSYNVENPITFNYTGSVQSYTFPSGIDAAKLEVWGAEGGGSRLSGNTSSGLGGLGGYSVGTINSPSGTVYVCVGGAGASSTSGLAAGGYNGGGSGYASSSSEPGNGGGGATHIAKSSGLLTAFSSNYSSQLLLVAGGGGGGGEDGSDKGGAGGGTSGETGQNSSTAQTGVCDGGTQTTPGQNAGFGYGASTNLGDGGGGGGGLYGGGSATSSSTGGDTYGGGGGSGYLSSSLSNAQTIIGTSSMPSPDGGTMTGRQGNGLARITLITSEDCVSEAKSITVTVNQPAAPTNVQVTNIGLITATASWSGSASSYKWRIDSGAWYTTNNTSVNLTGLTPGQTYTFRVKAVGTGTCESDEVTATFTTQNTHNVTVSANPNNGGTASGGGTITHGTNCTVTATPATGWHFVSWTENGSVVSNANPYTFQVNADHNLVANFAQDEYNITYTNDGNGSCSGVTTAYYGDNVTVTVTPNAGYELNTLTYNDGTSHTITVTNNQGSFSMPLHAVTVNATFNKIDYTITYSPAQSSPSNGGYISGLTTAQIGDNITVTINENTGYHLTGITATSNGTSVTLNGSGNTRTFTMPAGDVAVSATFAINEYAITVTPVPSTYYGTVTGGGTFTHGQSVTVTATPAQATYVFVNWTRGNEEGAEVMSTDATYTFTAVESIDLVAHFDFQPPVVTTDNVAVANITNTNAGVSGSISTNGSIYSYGFCWSNTNSTPTTSDYQAGVGAPNTHWEGAFSYTIPATGSLASNTLYYLRAYAAYPQGTAYGNVVTFTTQATATQPTVNSYLTTSANVTGGYTTDGNESITGCGFVYGTNSNPTIGDGTQVAMQSVSASFNADITGLTGNTTYYVRSYVTNAGGTNYGPVTTVTTLPYYPVTANVVPATYGSVTFNPAGIQASEAQTVQIGTDSIDLNVTSFLPIYANTASVPYSFAEIIYEHTSTMMEGDITSISFLYSQQGNGNLNHSIDIYLTHTTKTAFTSNTDFVPVTSEDRYFHGAIVATNADQWVTIELDEPFHYNGEDNIVVGVDYNGVNGVNGDTRKWYYTTTSNVTCLCNYGSSDIVPTASTIGGSSMWRYLDELKKRPNIKFTIEAANSDTHYYAYGDNVELTAVPASADYVFSYWTIDGSTTSTSNPYPIQNITAAHSVTANFVLSYKRFVTDGNWNVGGNWDPAGVPDITEDVSIEANAVIPASVIAYANNIRPITHANSSITIEDGGQLVHNNGSDNMVTVTVENDIDGYTAAEANTNKGYEILSFPVDNLTAGNSAITGAFTADPYDFYRFDASVDPLEWVHMAGNSAISLLDGFIYASQEGTTVTVTGPVMSSASTYSSSDVTFLDNDAPRFNGWALLGNPFVCNAYVSLGTGYGAGAEANFYKLYNNTDYDEFIPFASGDAVTPMGGVMFRVYDDDNIVYSRTAPSGAKTGILNVDVNKATTRGTTTLDRARVRFGEGRNLQKFQFDTRHTKIYIPDGDEDFSVYYADGAGTIPVNFKAQDNGRYTLDFSTEDVGFNYLHLIDNMNGNDVDLLQTPYYMFDAKSTDFASRFLLVFATGNDNGETFAFFNNGVWIINNDGEATLQVVDALGRILSSENITGSCSKAINAAPGVYMLRLINGDNVKVQKVVVRR